MPTEVKVQRIVKDSMLICPLEEFQYKHCRDTQLKRKRNEEKKKTERRQKEEKKKCLKNRSILNTDNVKIGRLSICEIKAKLK